MKWATMIMTEIVDFFSYWRYELGIAIGVLVAGAGVILWFM